MATDADTKLATFLLEQGVTAPTVDGVFVALDLGVLGPTLGDYDEGLVESLRHVEILTVANTTLRTLDLSGFGRLKELRIGGARREIQINVSECPHLRSITLLPYAPDSGDVYETLVLCRMDQLTTGAAEAMEETGKTAGGLLTVRFEFVDGSEFSGAQRVRVVGGEMLGWLSRHPTTDLATILASYWSEAPWFWAQYDDSSELGGPMRITYQRMRDIESRVASGFYRSRAHPFDIRDEAWKYTSRDKDPEAVYARDIPPWMLVAPYA